MFSRESAQKRANYTDVNPKLPQFLPESSRGMTDLFLRGRVGGWCTTCGAVNKIAECVRIISEDTSAVTCLVKLECSHERAFSQAIARTSKAIEKLKASKARAKLAQEANDLAQLDMQEPVEQEADDTVHELRVRDDGQC